MSDCPPKIPKRMLPEEEKKAWIMSAKATAELDMPEQGRVQHESNIEAIHRKENYTRSMTELGRFIDNLAGVDNDLSFGNPPAEKLKKHTKFMSIPETMQLISRDTANRILSLKKTSLFLLLGAIVTQEEKEAMWTRVEKMQLAIMNAQTEGKEGGLTVVDSFDSYSLKDLAGANLEDGNIFRSFCFEARHLNKQEELTKETVPHRLNAREVRLDMRTQRIHTDRNGKKWESMYAVNLYLEEMQMSGKRLNERLSNDKQLQEFARKLLHASQEFNQTVGSLFDRVSTLDHMYDFRAPCHERMDLFSNKYAEDHGVTSILDVFFIDGKLAEEALPQVDEMTDRICRNPALIPMVLDSPAQKAGEEPPACSLNLP